MESDNREQAAEVDHLRWGRFEDWVQLVRFPNVFSLFANCAAASIIAVGSLSRLNTVIPLFFVSALAYWAGMIFNDVNDLEEDRKHRPDRPLAAGKISPAVASHVATAMLMLGLLILSIVVVRAKGYTEWMVYSLGCYCLLWLSIRLYNSQLKATLLGPLLMGLCRALNILVVGYAMLGVYWEKDFSTVREFPDTMVAYAVAMGVYICGITVYASREEQASNQGSLALGIILELAGLVVIGCLPMWTAGRPVSWYFPTNSAYPVLVGLIGLTILNRGIQGVVHPVPRKVQLAVKHAILSIIMIDAAIVLVFAGQWYGIGVVLLLLPAVVGAMRVRTT